LYTHGTVAHINLSVDILVAEKSQPTVSAYGRYPWLTGHGSISSTTAFAKLPESSSNISLAKSLHVDAKNVTTASTSVIRPRLSVPGNSKSTAMSKFYKEMVPLSRRPLKKTDNVQTKIKQFEDIALQENGVSCCSDCGIAGKVRDLKSSPQQRQQYRVKRAETWSFRSPVTRDTPLVHGDTGRPQARTQYTFHSPKKVKDDSSYVHGISNK